MSTKENFKRYQFEFSPEAVDSLDRMVDYSDSTKASVMRNALRLYDHVCSIAKEKGGETLEIKKDGNTIDQVPIKFLCG